MEGYAVVSRGGVVLWHFGELDTTIWLVNRIINDWILSSSRAGSQSAKSSGSADIGHFKAHWSINTGFSLLFLAFVHNSVALAHVPSLLTDIESLFVKIVLSDSSYSSGKWSNTSGTIAVGGVDEPEHLIDRINEKFARLFELRLQQVQQKRSSFRQDSQIIADSASVQANAKSTSSNTNSVEKNDKVRVNGEIPDANNEQARSGSADNAATANSKKNSKKMRKWNNGGFSDSIVDDKSLDYSGNDASDALANTALNSDSVIDQSSPSRSADLAAMSKIKEIIESDIGATAVNDSSSSGLSQSRVLGFFKSLITGQKLSMDDLDPVLAQVRDNLIAKNVAADAANSICDGIKDSLVGRNIGTFDAVSKIVTAAVEDRLTQILTPSRIIDLVAEIWKVRNSGSFGRFTAQGKRSRPYTISLIGVNGVGKSTSLAKLAFFLLGNKLRVLIAACDTFRSGAVEQLRVHVRNLSQISDRTAVELFERGYGREAGAIARDAIEYADKNGFDVVLIDTAGRRHNDKILMGSLEKFVQSVHLDLILQVAEALVGTDSIMQVKNFQRALGESRHLDGFIISKIDVVGDMIGTIVSMVYTSDVPVLFVGVGQTYTDLRLFSVKWATKMLLLI